LFELTVTTILPRVPPDTRAASLRSG